MTDTRNELLTKILAATETGGTGESPTKAYIGYDATTPTALSLTPVMVSGFLQTIAPVGFTYANGVFTVDDELGGVYEAVVERVYENNDTNPASPVEVTIDVRVNGSSVFTRTLPISAATANDEPAYLTITSDFIYELSNGDELSVYVSAEENGSNPDDCNLFNMRVTAKKIFAS